MQENNIVNIRIHGYELPVVYRNLILTQPVCDHHEFSFVWNAGYFKSDANFQLKVIKTFIGASISISFGDKEFSGLITEISIDDRNSNSQSFIIKGSSPTVLTDDIPRSSSYYKKKLSDIVTKVLESVPDNAIVKSISPVNTDPLHYTTQYNETDFQFLCRLATRYGEWFYYDGSKLVFGKTGDSGVKLKAGSDLDRIVIQANLQPSKFNYKSYDAHKGEPINKNLASLNKDIKNDFSTTTTTNSLSTFSIS
ncbi:MAG: contractile injection system protein, VgrG/Pvc8 family, partial [Bacteroidota bacterium]